MTASILLSLLTFLPCLGALIVLCLPQKQTEALRLTTLVTTIGVLLLSLFMFISPPNTGGDVATNVGFLAGEAGMQNNFTMDWIPSFNIYYHMGIDGISLPLVVLTAFLFVVSMLASWSITKQVKTYCILYLLLETGVIGVFLSLDFFLFFVFWEVMLLPMYFLIGVWGGPRREYAATKFFLYTFAGGVMMLIAILLLYYHSDLTKLSAEQVAELKLSAPEQAALTKAAEANRPAHTFNLLALQKIGMETKQFSIVDPEVDALLFGQSVQFWAFLLLFIGFAIKVPSFPVHTWLPDAHVEAPTPISMILAGILLKLGGYGIIRICYPICPEAGYALAYPVALVGVVSIIYGAFAAMAQKDFKRLVAYSSVSHMGYVVLGMACWSAVSGTGYTAQYWQMGMNGAMFQMIAHGLSSAGMFFLVGVVYDRVHHRNLDDFGGLLAIMPRYGFFAMLIFFAGLGLPGLCGFIGEVFVVLSVFRYDIFLAILSAFAVILTAGYILWTIQRVYLGAEYKGPHPEALSEMNWRETLVIAPLTVFAIWFGVYPQALFKYMQPSIDHEVQQLADWSATNKPDMPKPEDKPADEQPKPETKVAER